VLDQGQGIDDGAKSVVAAELQVLKQGREYAPVVPRKFPLHHGLSE
jgi:hypothetical protein